MKAEVLTNRDGYRIALAPGSVVLISPEGKPLYWSSVGEKTPFEGMVMVGAFAAVEAIERARRA